MNWAYVAGFYDGEGSVMLTSNVRYSFTPHIAIVQSKDIGLQTLTEMKEFFEDNGLKVNRIYDASHDPSRCIHKVWNPLYSLRITNAPSVQKFLKHVLPYVRVKKVKSQDTLRIMKLFPKRQKVTRWSKADDARKTG